MFSSTIYLKVLLSFFFTLYSVYFFHFMLIRKDFFKPSFLQKLNLQGKTREQDLYLLNTYQFAFILK